MPIPFIIWGAAAVIGAMGAAKATEAYVETKDEELQRKIQSFNNSSSGYKLRNLDHQVDYFQDSLKSALSSAKAFAEKHTDITPSGKTDFPKITSLREKAAQIDSMASVLYKLTDLTGDKQGYKNAQKSSAYAATHSHPYLAAAGITIATISTIFSINSKLQQAEEKMTEIRLKGDAISSSASKLRDDFSDVCKVIDKSIDDYVKSGDTDIALAFNQAKIIAIQEYA